MATTEILSDDTPHCFDNQDDAFKFHYTHGGYLWKRDDGIPQRKAWVNGIIPTHWLSTHSLFMVHGRKPTDADVKESTHAVCNNPNHEIPL